MPREKTYRIFVGFDGFIDTLSECVDVRRDDGSYKKITSLGLFAKRVAKASGKSANIECVVKESTLGGNAPLCAQALLSLGHDVHLIGCCGYPKIHPLFLPLKIDGTLISIGEPGVTEALEFLDGKLMLGKMGELSELSFAQAAARLSAGLLLREVQEADVIATVNWTMMPLVEEFWQWLLLYPNLIEDKTLFVDLADPAKRPKNDVLAAMRLLQHLSTSCNVILGLNLSEAEQICSYFHLRPPKTLQKMAEALIGKLKISTLFIHARQEVAAATLCPAESARLKVPFCRTPSRSTGAGDVSNAGFISAVVHKLPLRDQLKMAVAAAGVWVRTGQPPSCEAVKTFLSTWKL